MNSVTEMPAKHQKEWMVNGVTGAQMHRSELARMTGGEMYYDYWGLADCLTARQRRQWNAALQCELDAACENAGKEW